MQEEVDYEIFISRCEHKKRHLEDHNCRIQGSY